MQYSSLPGVQHAIEVNMLFYMFAAIEMLAGQGIYLISSNP